MDAEQTTTRVVHNGRLVIASVKWWLEHGGIPKEELYCLHSVQLDQQCPECRRETQ
jgi:hypothetical protein